MRRLANSNDVKNVCKEVVQEFDRYQGCETDVSNVISIGLKKMCVDFIDGHLKLLDEVKCTERRMIKTMPELVQNGISFLQLKSEAASQHPIDIAPLPPNRPLVSDCMYTTAMTYLFAVLCIVMPFVVIVMEHHTPSKSTAPRHQNYASSFVQQEEALSVDRFVAKRRNDTVLCGHLQYMSTLCVALCLSERGIQNLDFYCC